METGGDVLVFNPDTEFKVLEEFEFDELIQRPENVRFFTLTEQTVDLTEKLLPKTGKISKALLKKVEYEVDSFKKLYSQVLRETPTGFEKARLERPTSLPWVMYYNKTPAQTTPFLWTDKWTPLFEASRGLQPNYYNQLLDSLPKSGIFFPEGTQTLYPAVVNGIKTLGPYEYTKTAYREDGTHRIQKVYRPGTEDVSTFTGYTIAVPPLAPPAPLDDHPFLSAREKPITIETTEDLPTILPDMEAIFQHAIPRTYNPYKDAVPYLKIYDIKLSQVPWSLWKENFPPVELVEESAPPIEIPFKVDEGSAPSKVLTEVYKSQWFPGLSARKWLSLQLDGGNLVAKILISQVGNLGPIAIPPPTLLPPPVPIEGTAEDCLPSVITDFNDFADRGIYRSPRCAVCNWYGHGASDCPDRRGPVKQEYKPGGGCIPLAFIASERSEEIYQGKQPWLPGTDSTILQEYQRLISRYTEQHVEYFSKPPEADASAPISETRTFINAILQDETRTSEDKSIDIRAILEEDEAELKKHIFTEKDTGQFLICEHTLRIQDGVLEKDPDAFLREWSAKEAGFYTCKYCGERISEVLQFQEEFDENGRIVQMRSKIAKPSFIPEEHQTFASSLKRLQLLFNDKDPAEDIFYLLMSLIQVLPEEEQLKQILDFVRSESNKLKTKMTKDLSNLHYAQALFGFGGFVIMMQTHKPQLIPRRSFGSRPMVLRGFPRDTTDTSDAPIIDSLLYVLLTTFEGYPSTFKGASVVLLRNVLNDNKNVRKLAISTISKVFVPRFKDALQKAKDSIAAVDVSYVLHNAFKPPIVRPPKDVSFLDPKTSLTVNESRFKCITPSPSWLIPSMPFSFKQSELNITIPIRPSSKAQPVPAPPTVLGPVVPSKDEVRSLQRQKQAPFKPMKTVIDTGKAEFIRSVLLEWMNVLGQSKTASAELKTYIRSRRVQIEHAHDNESMLRDYFSGIMNELVGMFINDETLVSLIERSMTDDILIRSLFAKPDESKRNIDYLRAREREEFKERMRRLPDAQRELRKELIDRGLAPYIITRDDREAFVAQLEEVKQLPVEETEAVTDDVAEEDKNIDRDMGPQGEVPEANGVELQYDYGDYGDMRADQEGDYAQSFADEEF